MVNYYPQWSNHPHEANQPDHPDMVNHPPHYTNGSIECIDAIEAALGSEGFIEYCRGQAIKYVWRAPHKGNMNEDLAKAVWYLKRAMQHG